MSDPRTRYYRAFEVYTDHAIRRPSGKIMVAATLLEDIAAAIMPATVLRPPDRQRLDRLQFLLDSNPPAASIVVALVDELDRLAQEVSPSPLAELANKWRAETEAELADIRRALDHTAANIRHELRGEDTP